MNQNDANKMLTSIRGGRVSGLMWAHLTTTVTDGHTEYGVVGFTTTGRDVTFSTPADLQKYVGAVRKATPKAPDKGNPKNKR